jgi:hypothetical protein
MTKLVAESIYFLICTEWILWRHGLPALLDSLPRPPIPAAIPGDYTPEQVCGAVDMACVLYFKRVLCLQRSAVTAMILRRHRFAAQLVIGARILPFKSHAWVELCGAVVNDKPYIPQLYQELERR